MNNCATKWRSVAIVALVAVLQGCGAPLNSSQPVEASGLMLFRSYRQSGRPVNYGELAEYLEKRPNSHGDAVAAKWWRRISGWVAMGSGVVIYSALAGDPNDPNAQSDRKELLSTAGGLFVLASLIGLLGTSYMDDAVAIHNQRFSTVRRERPRLDASPTLLNDSTPDSWLRPPDADLPKPSEVESP